MKIGHLLVCTLFVSLGSLAGCAAEQEEPSTEAAPTVDEPGSEPSACRVIIAGKDETARFPCEAQPGSGAGAGIGGGGSVGSPSQSTVHKIVCGNACGTVERACTAGCRSRYGEGSTPLTACLARCESAHTACVKDCR